MQQVWEFLHIHIQPETSHQRQAQRDKSWLQLPVSTVCFALFFRQSDLPGDLFWPVLVCRWCSDGKKTFSSRAMLEKHIQLRHRMDVGSQDKLMVKWAHGPAVTCCCWYRKRGGGLGRFFTWCSFGSVEKRWSGQFFGARYPGEGSLQKERSGENGAGWGVRGWAEPFQEVPAVFCSGLLPPARVRVPLRAVRLHHRGPGVLPGAHKPTPARRHGERRSAVSPVWRLLHIHLLYGSPLLHRPQGAKGPHWRPPLPQRRASTFSQYYQEPREEFPWQFYASISLVQRANWRRAVVNV